MWSWSAFTTAAATTPPPAPRPHGRPSYDPAHRLKGEAELALKLYDEAAKSFEACVVLRRTAPDPSVYREQALASRMLRKYADAVAGAGVTIQADGYGVVLQSHFTDVAFNVIGADAGGTLALPNYSGGVQLNNVSGNVIANNLISGNAGDGIDLFGGDGNVVGGSGAGEGNVLSANQFDGIGIFFDIQDVVQGNKVGTNLAGDATPGNINNGIALPQSTAILIGGTAAGAGNLIAGNGADGINAEADTQDTIQGNQIGGPGSLRIGGNGIVLTDAANMLIGGTAARRQRAANCGGRASNRLRSALHTRARHIFRRGPPQ
jgi:parallel beta-helix repeat protein